MALFIEFGEGLGEAVRMLNTASESTGYRMKRMALRWEFKTAAGLDRVRLPSNRDLFLSGKGRPAYFRVTVGIEPLQGGHPEQGD